MKLLSWLAILLIAFTTIKRPDGKKVLIVENDGHSNQTFNIKFNGQWATSTLAGGAVATYVW